MAKKAQENGARAAKQVRYRDAAELAGSLALLAKEVRLPMAVAMRVALMRREAEAAQEAFDSERRKLHRDYLAAQKNGDKQQAAADYQDAVNAQANETFEVAGSISYATIEEGVGEEKPENLGNILAGIMPVLEGVPE